MKREPHELSGLSATEIVPELPVPTPGFRRKAWLEFQRALNPLAPPKSFPKQLRPPPHA